MTPYTYLIGWAEQGKYYYGVRYSKDCNPSDLWTKYFTSSKHVHAFREQYGEPDVIQVRKTFETRDEAIKHEHKVLRRLGCVAREDFLTRTENRGIPPEFAGKNSMLGKKHRADSIEKMRKKHKMPANISEIARQRAVGKSGSKNANFIGHIHTPTGVYESLNAAAKGELLTVGQIHYRLHNPKYNDYYRVRA